MLCQLYFRFAYKDLLENIKQKIRMMYELSMRIFILKEMPMELIWE